MMTDLMIINMYLFVGFCLCILVSFVSTIYRLLIFSNKCDVNAIKQALPCSCLEMEGALKKDQVGVRFQVGSSPSSSSDEISSPAEESSGVLHSCKKAKNNESNR